VAVLVSILFAARNFSNVVCVAIGKSRLGSEKHSDVDIQHTAPTISSIDARIPDLETLVHHHGRWNDRCLQEMKEWAITARRISQDKSPEVVRGFSLPRTVESRPYRVPEAYCGSNGGNNNNHRSH
jgi:hypothetical protein